MRFARALSLVLVFCLASTFTLACAFACQDPSAPAVNSHCHQAKTDPAPVNAPSFSKPATECPMLAEMDSRPASLSASSVAKVSVQPHAILPLETAILFNGQEPARILPRPVSPWPLPLYLQKRTLRI